MTLRPVFLIPQVYVKALMSLALGRHLQNSHILKVEDVLKYLISSNRKRKRVRKAGDREKEGWEEARPETEMIGKRY